VAVLWLCSRGTTAVQPQLCDFTVNFTITPGPVHSNFAITSLLLQRQCKATAKTAQPGVFNTAVISQQNPALGLMSKKHQENIIKIASF
jgi:hypothetical protein